MYMRKASCNTQSNTPRTSNRWAYAKLGMMPPESFMAAAAQQMLHDMARSVPQDISNMLWVHCQAQWRCCVCCGLSVCKTPGSAIPLITHFWASQTVPTFLQAYATLRYSPGTPLMNGAAAHAVYCMPRFKPQEVGAPDPAGGRLHGVKTAGSLVRQ